jgi:predicted flavoprotein YhiN
MLTKKCKFKLFTIGISIFLIAGEIQAQSLKVSTGNRWVEAWGRMTQEVWIVSMEQSISITEVVVNRGNCAYPKTFPTPFRMGYGDKLSVNVERCEVLEVQIKTNKGDKTYQFN